MAYRLLVLALLSLVFGGCSKFSSHAAEELLTQRQPTDCQTYSHNLLYEAPRLYYAGQFDTLNDVINFVRDECGEDEPLFASRALLAIENSQYADTLLPRDLVYNLMERRFTQESWATRVPIFRQYGWWSSQPNDEIAQKFDDFRDTLAERAAAVAAEGTTQHALALFYVGEYDSALTLMQSPPLTRTALGKRYTEYVGAVQATAPAAFVDFNTGFGGWNPQGQNRVFGSHPAWTLYAGGESKRVRIGGILSYRWRESKNAYQTLKLDSIISTKEFDGWYLGVDAGVKLFESSVFSFDLFAGVGGDWILSVDKNDSEWVSFKTFAVSLGARQRLFLSDRSGIYIGLEERYMFIDHDNPAGNDLTGNALSISLVFGISTEATLRDQYKHLNYQGSWRPPR